MSVDTYFDESYYPGMGIDRVPPVITSPADGATVAPVHDVAGTAQPGQMVTLWSAIGDDPLHVHANVQADADGNWVFSGAQVTGRDGDVARFVARTLGGSSDEIVVTVAGPVLEAVAPTEATTDVAHAFILTGQRLDSTPLQVRVVDPGGSARRLEPGSVSASQITVDITFADAGTAEVSLAATGDGTTTGPELTARLDVVVTEPEPEPVTVAPGSTVDVASTDDVVADPTTAWATGESATFTDGEHYWDGSAWADGAAPEVTP